MLHEFNIPFKWGNGSQNFITYFGDIYPGNIRFCPNYSEGFFIIPNSSLQALGKLPPEEQTPERYRKLGWEIRDRKIIHYEPIPSTQEFGAPLDGSHTLYRNGDDKWKRMMVFGAGASSFCSFGESKEEFFNSPMRPPLGQEIFHKRYTQLLNHFPGAEQAIPLFESRGWDIEGCMEEEWELAKNSFNKKITSRHINVQYYLSELFRQVSWEVLTHHKRGNLYGLFADKLHSFLSKRQNEKEKVGIVSFNYDTILDKYLEQNFDINFVKMEDYVNWQQNQIVLFKPHGSCNWGWEFRADKKLGQNQIQISQRLFENKTIPAEIYYDLLGNLSTNVYTGAWGIEKTTHPLDLGRYSLNKNRIRTFKHNEGGYYPALLIPHKNKDEFVMPYYHMHALSLYMSQIEELYLIGWKGNEDSFNAYLSKHAHNLKKIVIVNPDSEEVKRNLSKTLKLERYSFEEVKTFEEFVREKMDVLIK